MFHFKKKNCPPLIDTNTNIKWHTLLNLQTTHLKYNAFNKTQGI